MLSNRTRARFLVGAIGLVVGGLGAASCSGGDSKKVRVNPTEAGAGDAGEGGAVDARGGSGGRGGAETGNAGGLSNSGAGDSNAAAGAGNGGTAPSGGEGGAAGGLPEAAGMGGEAGASCDSVAAGSRIVIAFAAANPEHVTSLQWIDSTAATTPNVIGEGGPAHCTDPQEFFGQSYGAPEGQLPDPVVGGNLATLARCGLDATITSAAADCTQVAQLPVITSYDFYAGSRASEMRITRTVGFDANTPVYNGTVGLRPYVPRVSLGGLSTVIYPNEASTAVASTPATACGGDCFVPTGTTAVTGGTSWNGAWFADIDPNSGLALIVLRDPSMTSAVDLTVNYDSYSNANLASFVVLQPTAGWKAPITEIEYLCFADLTSWPQTARDAAQLPAGCGR